MGLWSEIELDELEHITILSTLMDIRCCADAGICNHDMAWIMKQRKLNAQAQTATQES